jgi:hypothetical protein
LVAAGDNGNADASDDIAKIIGDEPLPNDVKLLSPPLYLEDVRVHIAK